MGRQYRHIGLAGQPLDTISLALGPLAEVRNEDYFYVATLKIKLLKKPYNLLLYIRFCDISN